MAPTYDGEAPTLSQLAAKARNTADVLLDAVRAGRMPRNLDSAQRLCLALIEADARQQLVDTKPGAPKLNITLQASNAAPVTDAERDREEARLRLRASRGLPPPSAYQGDDDGEDQGP